VKPGEKPTSKKQSWLPNALAGLAMSTGIGYVAAAYTVSRWLTRPMRGKPKAVPEQFGLDAERLQCQTADGIRLAGWGISPLAPRGTIVLFHGLHQTRAHTLSRCALLSHAGYRCVTFDHRAHGESGGKRTSFGFHEGRDIAAAFELVRRRWPNEPIGALGLSMGGAAMCFAAQQIRDCRAIVLESCYYDIATAFKNRLQHGYPMWFQRLARGVIWMTEYRLGLRLEQLTPASYLKELGSAAVFLLTGTNDPHATTEEARQLYEHARGPKEIWFVPDAGHRDVFEVGAAAYRERILDFFERHLATRQAAAA
jgi:alpha-beta hydrolase superfamily lysophospholipase